MKRFFLGLTAVVLLAATASAQDSPKPPKPPPPPQKLPPKPPKSTDGPKDEKPRDDRHLETWYQVERQVETFAGGDNWISVGVYRNRREAEEAAEQYRGKEQVRVITIRVRRSADGS